MQTAPSSFFFNAVLKLNVDFTHSVDWSGMRETPAGVRGRGDPAGAERRGGSPERPRKAKRMERKSTDKFNTAFLKRKNPLLS